eukprot:264828-Rhodomonas_salina.4
MSVTKLTTPECCADEAIERHRACAGSGNGCQGHSDRGALSKAARSTPLFPSCSQQRLPSLNPSISLHQPAFIRFNML